MTESYKIKTDLGEIEFTEEYELSENWYGEDADGRRGVKRQYRETLDIRHIYLNGIKYEELPEKLKLDIEAEIDYYLEQQNE